LKSLLVDGNCVMAEVSCTELAAGVAAGLIASASRLTAGALASEAGFKTVIFGSIFMWCTSIDLGDSLHGCRQSQSC
jgi:hypothetical protein